MVEIHIPNMKHDGLNFLCVQFLICHRFYLLSLLFHRHPKFVEAVVLILPTMV